ncbi:MAG: hypothetical protein ABSD30_09430 [Candidatus Binatus sp.]|jgi:acyl-CoA reductase-like NAD-dependent aldehyde dehydrogenase
METRLFIAGRYVDAGANGAKLLTGGKYASLFGGARMSGLGRQGGRFSMEFWTEPKLVCVAYGEEDRDG